MKSFQLFIRLARPLFLFGGFLLYALGVGIARYLGTAIDWNVYLLGQAWVTTLQLSTHFLNEYYNSDADGENTNRTFFSGGSGMLREGHLPKRTALLAGFTCLAIVAYITVMLIAGGHLSSSALVIMILAFLGAFFYSSPPIRLEGSGYGELTTSILVAYLVPAFAYILQTGEIHRLVAMSTFSLTVLHLAMLLAFELPDYANDVKHNKRTLMVRLGWKNGMLLHNILVLSAFIVLGFAAILGLPRSVALPAFLTLPLGLLQVWQMRRIADGSPPNWNALTLTALALFAASAYLVTFAFWTN